MEPCACGRSFVPTLEMYIAHCQTPEHQGWRARTLDPDLMAENTPTVSPMYVCKCGAVHWADSRKGRAHASLGSVAA